MEAREWYPDGWTVYPNDTKAEVTAKVTRFANEVSSIMASVDDVCNNAGELNLKAEHEFDVKLMHVFGVKWDGFGESLAG